MEEWRGFPSSSVSDHLDLLQIVHLDARDEAEFDLEQVRNMDCKSVKTVTALGVQRAAKQLKECAQLGLVRGSFGRATEESLEESDAGARSFLGRASILP
jgi:hypothetical protein